jgi:hypothetical protein
VMAITAFGEEWTQSSCPGGLAMKIIAGCVIALAMIGGTGTAHDSPATKHKAAQRSTLRHLPNRVRLDNPSWRLRPVGSIVLRRPTGSLFGPRKPYSRRDASRHSVRWLNFHHPISVGAA